MAPSNPGINLESFIEGIAGAPDPATRHVAELMREVYTSGEYGSWALGGHPGGTETLMGLRLVAMRDGNFESAIVVIEDDDVSAVLQALGTIAAESPAIDDFPHLERIAKSLLTASGLRVVAGTSLSRFESGEQVIQVIYPKVLGDLLALPLPETMRRDLAAASATQFLQQVPHYGNKVIMSTGYDWNPT